LSIVTGQLVMGEFISELSIIFRPCGRYIVSQTVLNATVFI